MGTKVQCKNYQLGFYSMRDLNEANSSWPLYYEDEALSRQFYSASKQRLMNGYTEYDKEVLRQTILKHEATFRKQVHELHRLYRIQRELMDELKRKEQCGYSLQEQIALSSPFLPHMPAKDLAKQLTWSSPSLPALSVNCSSPFVYGADSGTLVLTDRIDALNNSEPPKSEPWKSSRILIDLQVPAEANSDNEVTENTNKNCVDRSKKFLDLNDDPERDNVEKLMLATDEGSTCRKRREVHLQLENGTKCHGLVDLNEPVEEVCYGEAGVSSLSDHPDSTPLHEKSQHQLPLKPNSTFQNQQGLYQNNGGEASSSGFLHVNEKEEIREWQFSSNQFEHLQMGKSICSSHSCSSRGISTSSEQLKLHHELSWTSLSSQNNVASWLKDLPVGNEHGKGHPVGKSSRLAAPSASGSFSIIPRFDSCNRVSTSDSSCRKSVSKTSHIPIANAQRSSISIEGSRSAYDKWEYSGSLRPQQSPGYKASYKNGFPHDFQLDSRTPSNLCSPEVSFDMSNINNGASIYQGKFEDNGSQKHSKGFNFMDVISAKDITSNPLSTNDSQDRCATQQSYFDGSNGAVSGGISWLKSTQVHNKSVNLNGAVGYDLNSAQDCSQTMSNNGVVSGSEEAANYSVKDVLHSRNKKNEVSGLLNDRKHVGLSFIDLNLNCTQTAPTITCEENPANRILVDVNSAATSLDQPALSVVSVDNELRSQAKLPVTNVSRKATYEIDLEAPIISHSESNMLSTEALRTNHPFSTFEVLSSRTDNGNEYEPLYLETASTAAEIIVSISSTTLRKRSNSITSQLSGLASEDTLYWFADIITSNMEDLETAGGTLREQGDEDGSLEHDGMDFFESMTLKLTETKPEDFWTRPLVPENQEEGPGVASLLLPKFKRGQVRRRRQKRDFQKDILPGLATLSRYEVTEDLQIIGGLMRASGQSWQMGTGKRTAGRNGRSCRGRGRWPQGGTTMVEIPVDPPPLQSNNSKLENDGSSMIGWGRTRRCRRQRCPSGNVTMHPPLT